MKKTIIMLVAIIIGICVPNVRAGLILQNQFNGSLLIAQAQSIGQIFIAEDAKITSIGFNIEKFNNGGSLDLWIELFEGEGNTGLSLGVSQVIGLSDNSTGFFDANFSSTTLTVGEIYTAILIADSSHWGVRELIWSFPGVEDPYADGDMFLNGFPAQQEDLAFRVIPIPEPTILSLLLLGGVSLVRKIKMNVELH